MLKKDYLTYGSVSKRLNLRKRDKIIKVVLIILITIGAIAVLGNIIDLFFIDPDYTEINYAISSGLLVHILLYQLFFSFSFRTTRDIDKVLEEDIPKNGEKTFLLVTTVIYKNGEVFSIDYREKD